MSSVQGPTQNPHGGRALVADTTIGLRVGPKSGKSPPTPLLAACSPAPNRRCLVPTASPGGPDYELMSHPSRSQFSAPAAAQMRAICLSHDGGPCRRVDLRCARDQALSPADRIFISADLKFTVSDWISLHTDVAVAKLKNCLAGLGFLRADPADPLTVAVEHYDVDHAGR